MCCGAIHWAKLKSVTYCLSQSRLKDLSGGKQKPGIRDYLPLGGHEIEIIGPFREDEAYRIAAKYDWIGNTV
jgi:tRNA(Arg) A34 adenosine deaminase TadA